jgi:hypothetical protein
MSLEAQADAVGRGNRIGDVFTCACAILGRVQVDCLRASLLFFNTPREMSTPCVHVSGSYDLVTGMRRILRDGVEIASDAISGGYLV